MPSFVVFGRYNTITADLYGRNTYMEHTQDFNDISVQDLTIPSDYNKLFKGRTVFITGTARSGTTLLGRIVGSLQPVYYLHEPVLLKILPVLYKYDRSMRPQLAHMLRLVLFEDFMLQVIHGRNANFNTMDLSYIGNYVDIKDIKERWSTFRRRIDVIDYLNSNNVLFVIKMPELQPVMSELKEIFPDALFLHTIRNGMDMVNSGIKSRGWFSKKFFNEQLLDWVYNGKNGERNIPWFVDDESKQFFGQWNDVTKAAYIWRIQNEKGLQFCSENKESCKEFKYEDLIVSPNKFVNKIIAFVEDRFQFKVSITDITKKNLESIRKYDYQDYDDIVESIEAPEKNKFVQLMSEQAYYSK